VTQDDLPKLRESQFQLMWVVLYALAWLPSAIFLAYVELIMTRRSVGKRGGWMMMIIINIMNGTLPSAIFLAYVELIMTRR
jgi:hypothetical protein